MPISSPIKTKQKALPIPTQKEIYLIYFTQDSKFLKRVGMYLELIHILRNKRR